MFRQTTIIGTIEQASACRSKPFCVQPIIHVEGAKPFCSQLDGSDGRAEGFGRHLAS